MFELSEGHCRLLKFVGDTRGGGDLVLSLPG